MRALILLLAMVGPKQQHTSDAQHIKYEPCYRNWCDQMMDRIPYEINYPYTPVLRPKPIVNITVDLKHEFGATADCPDGWTVDLTDLPGDTYWSREAMVNALSRVVCRKKVFADDLEERWRICNGWNKPGIEHQVSMHYSGLGFQGRDK